MPTCTFRSQRSAPVLTSLLLALGGCSSAPSSSGVLLVVPAGASETTASLADSLASYLEVIRGRAPARVSLDGSGLAAIERAASAQAAGVAIVLQAEALAPERIDSTRMSALGEWGFVLETEDCCDFENELGSDGVTTVLLAGNSRLSQQYAAYELLRRLGVRFYHPEAEYVPRRAPRHLRELIRRPTLLARAGRDYLPDFFWRSWAFHGAHPIEQLEALSDGDHPIDEAVRLNEWFVKNFGNRFRGPARGSARDEARSRRVRELETLRQRLGFPRGEDISLHNQQQGSTSDVDPEGPVPAEDQIEAIVRQKLAAAPDARWFGIHFGPSELTVTPDVQTVEWINRAGRTALVVEPAIEVEINSHITGGQPSPSFDDLGCPNETNDEGRIDYYDLPFHSDPRLGVRVHTVMFYPLEGPTPVYQQESFAHKRCLMQKASAEGRPLSWFPEGGWWLAFDNAVPVYLPLYIWSRARDVELLEPLLPRNGGTLRGHRMFTTGQEWGYWQQDYLAGLLAWNADLELEQLLGELTLPFCDSLALETDCTARRVTATVLGELIEHQRDSFLARTDYRGRPGGLYAYLAGEDEADILAELTGLALRPLRVSFATVNSWTAEELARFRETDLRWLEGAAAAHARWLERLREVTDEVPAAGRPWFDEITDGIAINRLRVAHTAALYRAVIDQREAVLAGAEDPRGAGDPEFRAAISATSEAEAVIRRREAAYRFPPAQAYGGGIEPETAIANGTTYKHRLYTKTHLLSYWRNRNAEAEAVLQGPPVGLDLIEAIAAPDQALGVRWPEDEKLDGALTIGALSVRPPTKAVALPPGEGQWPVQGTLRLSAGILELEGHIVRAADRAYTARGKAVVIAPANSTVQRVLSRLIPAHSWAWLSNPPALAFAPDLDGDRSVRFSDVTVVPAVLEGTRFVSSPTTLRLPVSEAGGVGGGEIAVEQAVFSGALEPRLSDAIALRGEIELSELVGALVSMAGFDEKGALALLAGLLGFSASDPPARVSFEASFPLE